MIMSTNQRGNRNRFAHLCASNATLEASRVCVGLQQRPKLKLRESERKKEELVACQVKVDEDIADMELLAVA